MRLTFPLSLKVSLWLLLNLVLLGAVGLGFIVAQGGVSWSALIDGAAGERVQTLANAIAAEAGAAGDEKRDAVLTRFAATYGAELFLFHNSGRQLAGPPLNPPPALRGQLIMPREGDGPRRDEAGARRPGPRAEPDEAPPPPPPREPPERARERGRGRLYLHTVAPAGHWIALRVPFNRADGSLPEPATLFMRVSSRWALLRLLDLQPWLLAGAAVLACSVVFWLPFVRGITRSLSQLTAATGRIAEGRFDTRVPEKRRDEIGALGHSVNTMAARLDTLVNGQKRFLGDVAHELCSPLARLQLATEILETRAEPPLHEHIADVREEVQRMSDLVNELLAFTKAGLRPRDAMLDPVALAPLVQRVLAREDPAARLTADVPANSHVLADAALLERALGNLVRNALRYAPTGAITLTTRRDAAHVLLTLTDEGPGVPPEALARLGEPFYRPDAARTSEAGGTGLGLAIVRSSITACGGTVMFRNGTPRGFAAEITLAASG